MKRPISKSVIQEFAKVYVYCCGLVVELVVSIDGAVENVRLQNMSRI
jgi:hypothetical protein